MDFMAMEYNVTDLLIQKKSQRLAIIAKMQFCMRIEEQIIWFKLFTCLVFQTLSAITLAMSCLASNQNYVLRDLVQ